MMRIALLFCCLVVLVVTFKPRYRPITAPSLSARSEDEKDEQLKIQQEMLERRKSKANMSEYFQKIDKIRKSVSSAAYKALWSQTDDAIDPIAKWRAAKTRGDIKPLGYEAEPPRNASKWGFNVVIPINPMGIPKYDQGERFDLRLPYAERGYESEDADVTGRFFRALRGWFGGKNGPKE